MKTKPLDMRGLTDRELALWLAQKDDAVRWASFQELVARGQKRGWEVYGLLTQDPDLAGMFVFPKTPFDAVGVVVGPAVYTDIREAWPGSVERVFQNGTRETAIDFRRLRLDVVLLAPASWPLEGETPEAREGLGEVEFLVNDLESFVRRIGLLDRDLRRRLTLLPGDETDSRFLLAQVRLSRGTRSVLVQLIRS